MAQAIRQANETNVKFHIPPHNGIDEPLISRNRFASLHAAFGGYATSQRTIPPVVIVASSARCWLFSELGCSLDHGTCSPCSHGLHGYLEGSPFPLKNETARTRGELALIDLNRALLLAPTRRVDSRRRPAFAPFDCSFTAGSWSYRVLVPTGRKRHSELIEL